jgi:putative membrane protein
MRVLLRWILGAVALFATVQIGHYLNLGIELKSGTEGVISAMIVVLALTLVNAVIRPIVAFFTAPLNCLTLGLFSFVVNALMFWIVASLNLGLTVAPGTRGFIAALFGSIVLSIISGLLNLFIQESKER